MPPLPPAPPATASSTENPDHLPASATVDDGDGNVDTLPGGRGRYGRVQGVERATGFGCSLYEPGVYA